MRPPPLPRLGLAARSLARVTRRAAIPAVLLTFVGCASASPPPPHAPPAPLAPGVVAEMNRGGGYGPSPSYWITIHADGTVDYHGSQWVKTLGDAPLRIPLGRVNEIREAFRRARYMDLADEYSHQKLTDLEWISTAYAEQGRTKRVNHYRGDDTAPPGLTKLEDEIARLVEIERAIGTPEELQVVGSSWAH